MTLERFFLKARQEAYIKKVKNFELRDVNNV